MVGIAFGDVAVSLSGRVDAQAKGDEVFFVFVE